MIAVFFLLALMAALFPAAAFATVEAEPNGGIGQADTVSDGFIVGNAGPTQTGDADFSRFWGNAGVTYTIETACPSLSDPTLELFDQLGSTVAFNDDWGLGLESHIAYVAPSDGWLYVKIAAWGNSPAGVYQVNISPMTPLANTAPVAADDSASGNEDNPIAGDVRSNDTDAEGDKLTASLVSGPSSGSLSLNANGTFDYSPNANYYGSDSFTYRMHDGTVYSGTATVDLTVNAINDSPIAGADVGSVNEDEVLFVAPPGVLANDSDPVEGSPLSAVMFGFPTHHSQYHLLSSGSYMYVPRANYNGPDSFSYRAWDGSAYSPVTTVSLTVSPVNDAPVAVGRTVSTDEDAPLNSDGADGVLSTASDIDGDPLTASLGSDVSHGTLELSPDGSYSYVPAENWYGADSFTFRAYDGVAYSNTVTVTINVAAINDVPMTSVDYSTVTEDESIWVGAPGVLENDNDVESDSMWAALWWYPSNGDVYFDGDGSYTYVPYADFFGTDVFTYSVWDGSGWSDPTPVIVTVEGTPDAPVSAADEFSGNEDSTFEIGAPGVLANDVDVDYDELSALLVTDVEHGDLTLNADGSFSYTPDENWYGTDSFEYNPYDGALHGITVTVTLNVSSVNDEPTAGVESYNLDEDTRLSVEGPGVLANDSDPVEGSPVTADLVSGVSNGSLSLDENGSFVYTPDENFNGSDSFTYRADDGDDYSNTVEVLLTVDAVNDAPVATGDSYSTEEDWALEIGSPGVLGNDSDVDGDELTAELVDGAGHGAVNLNADGSYVYTPDENYNGADAFSYRIFDGSVYSETVTVDLTVESAYDPPVAMEDIYTTDEDTTLDIPAAGLLANDLGDGPLTVNAWQDSDQGTAGTVIAWGNGRMRYVPEPGFNGVDTFVYRIGDGVNRSQYITVTINVIAVNDVPVAAGDSASTDEDVVIDSDGSSVLDNDSDSDGDSLVAELVDDVQHGTLALNEDGTYVYTPDENWSGEDGFSYRAYDGTDYSETVEVPITVEGVNDAPAGAEDAYTTDEDTALSIEAPGVLSNDSDADEDGLTAYLVEGASNGSLTFNEDGSFDYTPDENFYGEDSFAYVATDGDLDSEVLWVRIEVNSVNDLPTASSDEYGTQEDTELVVDEWSVLDNDADPVEESRLSAVLADDVSHGTLELNEDGTFSYLPNANWYGTDSFTYKASDGTDASDAATVEIYVDSMDDAPVAAPDAATTNEDVTLSVVAADGVLGNDSDVDGDELSAMLVEGPENGSLTFNPDGSYEYVPAADFNGSDSFTYQANDGSENSAAVTVSIDVTPVPDIDTSITITSASRRLANYGDEYALTGVLMADGDPIAGQVVVLQTSSGADATALKSTAITAITGADGTFTLKHVPRWRMYYRAVFTGDADYKAVTSDSRSALPKSWLSNPVAPSTMKVGKASNVYGYCRPRHEAGNKSIRIYKYRKVNGVWRSYGYVTATVTDATSSTGEEISKYSASVKLPYAGSWRLRAYHTSGWLHASAWSAGYDYVTVK